MPTRFVPDTFNSPRHHSLASRAGLSLACIVVGLLLALATASADVPQPGPSSQQLEAARSEYFAGVDGDSSASDRAQESFDALAKDYPQNAVVMAYSGSLELMQAARTWEVWNKHKLSTEGLEKLDRSLQLEPGNLEVRFIHGETSWHLPFFFHRKDQAERDFAYIAPRAEAAVRRGAFPAPLAAAALNRYGRILDDRNDHVGARAAWQAAVRVDSKSPGGLEAAKHLK